MNMSKPDFVSIVAKFFPFASQTELVDKLTTYQLSTFCKVQDASSNLTLSLTFMHTRVKNSIDVPVPTDGVLAAALRSLEHNAGDIASSRDAWRAMDSRTKTPVYVTKQLVIHTNTNAGLDVLPLKTMARRPLVCAFARILAAVVVQHLVSAGDQALPMPGAIATPIFLSFAVPATLASDAFGAAKLHGLVQANQDLCRVLKQHLASAGYKVAKLPMLPPDQKNPSDGPHPDACASAPAPAPAVAEEEKEEKKKKEEKKNAVPVPATPPRVTTKSPVPIPVATPKAAATPPQPQPQPVVAPSPSPAAAVVVAAAAAAVDGADRKTYQLLEEQLRAQQEQLRLVTESYRAVSGVVAELAPIVKTIPLLQSEVTALRSSADTLMDALKTAIAPFNALHADVERLAALTKAVTDAGAVVGATVAKGLKRTAAAAAATTATDTQDSNNNKRPKSEAPPPAPTAVPSDDFVPATPLPHLGASVMEDTILSDGTRYGATLPDDMKEPMCDGDAFASV